jgi:hypothetical protein
MVISSRKNQLKFERLSENNISAVLNKKSALYGERNFK